MITLFNSQLLNTFLVGMDSWTDHYERVLEVTVQKMTFSGKQVLPHIFVTNDNRDMILVASPTFSGSRNTFGLLPCTYSDLLCPKIQDGRQK